MLSATPSAHPELGSTPHIQFLDYAMSRLVSRLSWLQIDREYKLQFWRVPSRAEWFSSVLPSVAIKRLRPHYSAFP